MPPQGLREHDLTDTRVHQYIPHIGGDQQQSLSLRADQVRRFLSFADLKAT
jgi:hypothetical protein